MTPTPRTAAGRALLARITEYGTVWVRLDLGKGPEWMAVTSVVTPHEAYLRTIRKRLSSGA